MYYPTEFGSTDIKERYESSTRMYNGSCIEHTPKEKKDILFENGKIKHRQVTMLCDCIRPHLLAKLHNSGFLTKCNPISNDLCPMCGFFPYYLAPNQTFGDEEYTATLKEMNI